ncbi:hypothetical protein FN846DRAFT_960579 [Sphaerosporella brunnea]|uniref:Flavoprotein domain-containing protein n=1 Tax=Sphaerosporella brunnea TaxID=1250544 RepID=A0A5J5ERC8_9PEZI|nr:hypothetical protein FN846DRAFT_960579 [Sphaerosporella brunnea]
MANSSIQQLVTTLPQYPSNIKVILSPTATRFLSPSDLSSISAFAKLRKRADMSLIASLSANSLAGMAGGFCFGLGLSVVRAWDTAAAVGDRGAMGVAKLVASRVGKMILVAPAMNTQIEHLEKPGRWSWVKVLKPIWGVGGMMEVPDIVDNVLEVLGDQGNGDSGATSLARLKL